MLLHGIGLKRVVEILASAVSDVSLTVFLHPNFSPYQPPRPPTPYPLGENGEGIACSTAAYDDAEEDEITERSVKFSLPPSPARSTSTTGSIDSLPCDRSSPRLHHISSSPRSNSEETGKQIKYKSSSLDSTPSRGRSPGCGFDYSDPRNLKPFPRGYGSPSINLINNDWSGSLDRSLTTDPASPFRTMKLSREQTKGPIRVTHQVIPTSILPMKVSLHNNSSLNESDSSAFDYSRHNLSSNASPTPHHITRSSPTPHPSINAHMPTYENIQPAASSPDYENIIRYPDYKNKGSRDPSPAPSSRSQTPQRHRVMGRRERAALTSVGNRKVQFGSFKPINPNDDDEHYV